jgi:DNA-directed RNA polymerase subunit E'/Rpb7
MFKSVFCRGLACAAVPVTAFVHRRTVCQPKDDEPTDSNLVLMSGTANKQLSQQIADIVGIKLLDVATRRFSDGEISCTINESLRGNEEFTTF